MRTGWLVGLYVRESWSRVEVKVPQQYENIPCVKYYVNYYQKTLPPPFMANEIRMGLNIPGIIKVREFHPLDVVAVGGRQRETHTGNEYSGK